MEKIENTEQIFIKNCKLPAHTITNTVIEVLEELYDAEYLNARETIYADDDEQCPGHRYRSIIDIFNIVNTYRPGTTIKEVILGICEFNEKRKENSRKMRLLFYFCTDIDRCVLRRISATQLDCFSGWYDGESMFEYLKNISEDNCWEYFEEFDNYNYYFEEAGITEEYFNNLYKI